MAQVIDCPAAPAGTATAQADGRWLERYLSVLELDHGGGGMARDIAVAARRASSGLHDHLMQLTDRCQQLARAGALDSDERRILRASLVQALLPERAAGLGALEREIALSAQQLWRRLWYQNPAAPLSDANRWAVIVASPASEEVGWAALREHRRRWPDVHFELHRPYYPGRPLALVVGRRLNRADAAKLLGYVKELGMAADAYAWPLPLPDDPQLSNQTPARPAG